MASKKNIKKNKLENLHLKERINYGYRKVIIMMLVSGLLSIVVIGILFFNMKRYVQNVTVADQAVKICRINVNAAARNIREMALNNDASSYDNYEQTVKKMLAEVDTQLNNLKKSGLFRMRIMKNTHLPFQTGETLVIPSWKKSKAVTKIRQLIQF